MPPGTEVPTVAARLEQEFFSELLAMANAHDGLLPAYNQIWDDYIEQLKVYATIEDFDPKERLSAPHPIPLFINPAILRLLFRAWLRRRNLDPDEPPLSN